MLVPKEIESIVRNILAQLASGQYSAIAECTKEVRLSEQEISEAIRSYGRTFIAGPNDLAKFIDIVLIKESLPPSWSIVVPLFTEEEGMSDLSMELTVKEDGKGGLSVELDNIHVL